MSSTFNVNRQGFIWDKLFYIPFNSLPHVLWPRKHTFFIPTDCTGKKDSIQFISMNKIYILMLQMCLGKSSALAVVLLPKPRRTPRC